MPSGRVSVLSDMCRLGGVLLCLLACCCRLRQHRDGRLVDGYGLEGGNG